MVVTVATVTLVILAFSAGAFGPEQARARFFGVMLVFSGAMLVTITATTVTVLLMAWEVMGATSWVLIAYWWRDPERVHAAHMAFLTTRTADVGLYLAAGAALAGAPALALDDLERITGPWLTLVTGGVITAAFGKSAQLPFSFWLSKAMKGPSPVSALLHSATMVVAGAYLLLRARPLLDASGWGGPVVAWTGATTAVALGLVAVAQTDLKQLLAASSCAQIGFMVLAAGTGARTGGTLQLIAHAAAKSLAFLAAGAWLTALGTQALPALRGAARRHRTVGVTFTVAALSLAGVPPLSLWAAKDLVLAGALAEDPWLYATGTAGAALSAVYSAKALWFVWRPATSERGHLPGRSGNGRLPPLVHPPLILLAVACPALTAMAFPPLLEVTGRVLGATAQPVPDAWESILSGALAVLAGAAAWAWGDRTSPLPTRAGRWCGNWLGLGAAAHTLLVGPVLRLAGALAAFDDRVLDQAVDGAARGALRLARLSDRVTERRVVDGAVEGVAAVTRRLGASPGSRRQGSYTSTSPRPSPSSPPSPSCSSS